MALPTKRYRLVSNKDHRVPNPDYVEGKSDPIESHVTAKKGDIVSLTDEQFKAFKDKFVPVDNAATSTRDTDADALLAAQQIAEETGENVDPNTLTPEQIAEAKQKAELKSDPFAAARPQQ